MKSKTVASIMRHVATKTAGSAEEEIPKPVAAEPKPKKEPKEGEEGKEEEEEEELPPQSEHEERRLEQLYDQIAWPLADKFGHTYDAFKIALTFAFALSWLCRPS